MTFRRIWKYASKYKKLLLISSFALLLAIGIELLVPLCFKTIIDDYLVGIEQPWYEVDDTAGTTVQYNGHYYAQERNIKDRERWVRPENEVRVFLIAESFILSLKRSNPGQRKSGMTSWSLPPRTEISLRMIASAFPDKRQLRSIDRR